MTRIHIFSPRLTRYVGRDDGRIDCPLLLIKQRDQALRLNAFTGVEIAAKDFGSPAGKTTMIISRLVPVHASKPATATVQIVYDCPSEKAHERLPGQLPMALRERGVEVIISSWPPGKVDFSSIYLILLLIPSLILDNQLTFFLAPTLDLDPEMGLFHQLSRALRLHVRILGLLDSLIFFNVEALEKPLSSNELEIMVKACGINFKDVFVALG